MAGNETVKINRTRPKVYSSTRDKNSWIQKVPVSFPWTLDENVGSALLTLSEIPHRQWNLSNFQLNVESNLILLHSKVDSKSRSILLTLNTLTSQVRAQSQISSTAGRGKLFDWRRVQEKDGFVIVKDKLGWLNFSRHRNLAPRQDIKALVQSRKIETWQNGQSKIWLRWY